LQRIKINPFFLDGPNGKLFCLLFKPNNKKLKKNPCIVHLPAFCEEMNNSRRTIVTQAKKFAKSGYAVLIFDLYGTGDSEGDFSDVLWDVWRNDIIFILKWMISNHGEVTWLWGLRSGCLLATELPILFSVKGLIFWQPIVSGTQIIEQLERIKNLNEKSVVDNRSLVDERTTNAKEIKEIGGYEISNKFMEELKIKKMINYQLPPGIKLIWMEIKSLPNSRITPVSDEVIDELRKYDVKISQSIITGNPFWLTAQSDVTNQLIYKTTKYIEDK
jgi:exosortase A-associated hydrolase 2